jgi:hypothetical protein
MIWGINEALHGSVYETQLRFEKKKHFTAV